MKVKQLLILALMIMYVSGTATAQDTIYVDKINATKAFELQMPVMSDSTNLKGEKFDHEKSVDNGGEIANEERFY